jgi:hypothetical protein
VAACPSQNGSASLLLFVYGVNGGVLFFSHRETKLRTWKRRPVPLYACLDL